MNRYLRPFVREPFELIDFMVSYWPGTGGKILRAWWIRKRIRRIGDNPAIGMGVVFVGEDISIGNDFSIRRTSGLYAQDGVITIGDRVRLNANVSVGASNKGHISIGSDVLVGQNTVLRASNHAYGSIDIAIIRQGHTGGQIVVEDDVWIGANVVVTCDTRIGAHSIVGAGSVVTHDVEPYSIVGGVPAQLIRKRK